MRTRLAHLSRLPAPPSLRALNWPVPQALGWPALCGLALALLGCSKAAPPAAPPPAASAVAPGQSLAAATPPGEDCTLQTPLTPGVPGSPGHLIPSSRNPNGQSELAALMRRMEAALKEAGPRLQKGEHVGPFLPQFRRIRCSWPTNPADRDAEFDALAGAYLSAVSSLDTAADVASATRAYSGVLQGCRSCHERTCGGALAAIDALRLP